jgi:DNA-binding NarL/FixJ family response regulator
MSNGILIVDDSSVSRQSVRKIVELAGLTVCAEAVDGVDAVDKASELKPDLIVLDLRLPRLNGIEAAAILRGRLPKTPIVLFTMFDVNASQVSAAGISSVVQKLEGVVKLTKCIQELLPSHVANHGEPTTSQSVS